VLNEDQKIAFAKIFKDQLKFGEEMIGLLQPILQPVFSFDDESQTLLQSEEGVKALHALIHAFEQTSTLDFATVKAIFKDVQATTGIKGKPLFMPARLKLTGQLHGAELASIIPILGKVETLKRLKA
jgi:nondiscriminating glutamyl-tRNA synthetase